MKTINFKKGGQIKVVDEKNKKRIDELKEAGFVQVDLSVKGKIKEINPANKEIDKLKAEIVELKAKLKEALKK
jgi:hypothetical protein